MPGIFPPGYGQGLAAPGQALTVPGSGVGTGTPFTAPVKDGVDPHHAALAGNAGRVAALPGGMTPTQVRAMQQFLVNHGFAVNQDGIYGAQTKAAAAAFRANHKSGAAWSATHGTGVHPASKPGGASALASDAGGGNGSTPVATGPNTEGAFNALLGALLGQGGKVGSMLDPNAYGAAAAAPSTALAATLAQQAAQNPQQAAQDESDISSWYGLDPRATSYQLSVLGRLAQAKGKDAAAATDASSNIGALAKSLAGSIGGSANDGSAQVAAAGTDAAGTMAAVGQANTDYANAMNPLLAAEATGAMSRDKASKAQELQTLRDQMAQAQGQARADRAAGMSGAIDKNNALGQQRFADQGNLLSTLGQMQAVDPNEVGLKDAKLAAQIDQIRAGTAKTASGLASAAAKAQKMDIGNTTREIIDHLGYGSIPTTGQAIVPTSDHQRLATTIGAFLRSQGLRPGDGQFKKIGDAILGSFVDEHGRPIQPGAGWAI